MTYFVWDERKNIVLKQERKVSFEDVLIAIQEGHVLAIIKHPNQKHYPNQKIFIIELHDYAYAVPFIENDENIVLKTIFPSRQHTRDYIEKGGT